MWRRIVEGNGLRRLPSRVLRKARQGPGPLAEAVAHHLWRRGPVGRIRRSLALRRIRTRPPAAGDLVGSLVPGLFTVVLPVYNQARFLRESIESVLDQTYPSFELIVIDDGSGPDVAEILRDSLDNPRVRALRQHNQQLPRALSNGFAFARGEFWTWTSADNRMHPLQLERLVGCLQSRPEVGMVYADYRAIDASGEPLTDPTFRPDNRRTPSAPEIHLPRNPRAINAIPDNFIGPCFLYRGAVGRLVGEYDPGLGIEDYDYWMRINRASRIEHLGTDEVLYDYRVHPQSLSGRAAELRIAERANELLRTERARDRDHREPWSIRVDTAIHHRLAGLDQSPHRWLPLDAPFDSSAKTLYLIDNSSLDIINPQDPSIVVAWFDRLEEAYERRVAAAQSGAFALTSHRDLAERLDLLGIPNLVVDTPSMFLDRALRYADNRRSFERLRPPADRGRILPIPISYESNYHIVIQVDDFDRGGLENVVLCLAEGLRRRGRRVSMLVLGRPGPSVDRARAAGIPVEIGLVESRGVSIREWLQSNQADLVCAHYSTAAAAPAHDLGIPFVQVIHNAYAWLDDRAFDAYRKADAATTAYLCVSAETARYADRRMGLSAEKMIVVPNGVDLDRIDAALNEDPSRTRAELGLSAEDFVFLNVASIHATKAHRLLVKAFARVIDERPSARLVIAGSTSDTDYESRLRREIEAMKLSDRVVLTGHREDVERLYAMADAFVLPSLWEGWSLALTEAACAGLPAIASDVGGARELLASGLGRLIRPPFDSIDQLDADVIPRLIGREDPRFLNDLADAMRAEAAVRRRPVIPDNLRRRLDRETMIEIHDRLLGWFLQGGGASGARAWSPPFVMPRLDSPARLS